MDAEVVDLRTFAPLDIESVTESVSKTGHLVVVELGRRHFGAAAEIVSGVCEAIGPQMKSAPARVTWPHSHIPTSAPLEDAYYPTAKDIVGACLQRLKT